jgi:hypothetical protein
MAGAYVPKHVFFMQINLFLVEVRGEMERMRKS